MINAFALASALCISQAPGPKIAFEKTHHDFGRISHLQRATIKYKFTNAGSAPLVIKNIIPSCGCILQMVGKKHLQPGESSYVQIGFDPAGMMGNIHKSIAVTSNDPLNPKTTLTFEAGVMQEITANATTLMFSNVPRLETVTMSILLESGNGRPVDVTETIIPGTAPFISCARRRDGNDVILDISINGGLIPEQMPDGLEIITVKTTNKSHPAFNFRIQWELAASIVASPNRITLHEPVGHEYKATVHLTSKNNKPFQILGATSSSSMITVANISQGLAVGHTFDVVLSSKAKAGSYMENIVLELGDPDQPTLKVGVVAILR
jgi:hypothetical protein